MNEIQHYLFSTTDITCTNYIGEHSEMSSHILVFSETKEKTEFKFYNINVEYQNIPYKQKYDVILFCEVLEHLTNDPLNALINIKSALKTDGYLILTTPNVNRLENVANMINGRNIYDPYSAYGIYGRHNREYNKHELCSLLNQLGFEIEIIFSSDVRDSHLPIRRFWELLKFRRSNLGQYIFIRAKNRKDMNKKKPGWLYRSYPE